MVVNVFAEELEQALENVTKTQAFAEGTIFGMAIGTAVIVGLVWFILEVIADWKIFTKAGRPGWKSIVPFLSDYEEFELSWKGKGVFGLISSVLISASYLIDAFVAEPWPTWVMIVCTAISLNILVISIMQNRRLARSFGKGTGFFLGLLFLGPLFRLILGFGKAKYQGPQD